MSNWNSLRYKWSHEHYLHRMAVRSFNSVAKYIPFAMKYGLGIKMRSRTPPYSLIKEGNIVVQVGAPQDTLSTGRSRAMYFSLLAGPTGTVVIVEPDRDSLDGWQKLIDEHDYQNIILCNTAVWSHRDRLRLYINDAHPASNFTEGSKDHYGEAQLQEYRIVELPANSLDNILRERGVDHVDLVSITTNGAEPQILGGMSETIAAGLPYICLARTGENYLGLMESLGYELLADDDRGYTFRRKLN